VHSVISCPRPLAKPVYFKNCLAKPYYVKHPPLYLSAVSATPYVRQLLHWTTLFSTVIAKLYNCYG